MVFPGGECKAVRKWQKCQWFAISSIFIALQCSTSLAFFFPHSFELKRNCFRKGANFATDSKRLERSTSIFLKSTEITSQNDREVAKLLDRNDVEFYVGCIVRVNSSTLRAHHVSKQGYGYFNDNKEFIPCADATERKDKSLLIPEGLRGIVTRVHDINDLSTNFPIHVKFIKGDNVEEGYSSPLTFKMHFDTREVDVVV